MILKATNITAYNGSYLALFGVNFCAKQNSTHIIYYQSRGGATTLAKILCGLKQPSEGGVTISNKQATAQTSNTSLLLSSPVFFNHKSAQKNLEYAQKIIGDFSQNVAQILKWHNINPKQKPAHMSTYQKQLLQILRAQISNKKIIIADNIFSNLTQAETNNLLPVFENLTQNKTTIILTTNTEFTKKGAICHTLYCGELHIKPKSISNAQNLFALNVFFKNAKLLCGSLQKRGKIKCGKQSVVPPNPKATAEAASRGISKVVFVPKSKNNMAPKAVFDLSDGYKIC